MIELTREQARAISEQSSPLQVLYPRTQEVFVLISRNVYELTCNIVGGGQGKIWGDEADEGLTRKDA